MLKILLVEDDTEISSFIKPELELNYCNVTIATDFETAEKTIYENVPDVIIMETHISATSGFAFCQQIKTTGITTPFLMLTSLDHVDDTVHALECGADDILVKPFHINELLARVNALHRRHKLYMAPPPKYSIANLRIDKDLKKVFRDEVEIHLSGKEFQILELLMIHQNKVLSQDIIADKIWGFKMKTTNLIGVYINAIRNKIDRPYSPKLLQTVVGFGFVLREPE